MKNLRLHLVLAALTLVAALAALGLGGSLPIHAALPSTGGGVTSTQTNLLVLRVFFTSTAQRDALANELGAEEVSTTGGYLTVLGDQPEMNDLQARGLHVEIDQLATKSLLDFMARRDTFYNGFKTVEEEGQYLNTMAATYPTLATVVDYGDSWCKIHLGSCTQPNAYNGYDLLALHITNHAITGPKPVFWFDAGIHSREIATPETAMLLISWLLDGYNSNPDAHWLVDYHDIYIVPMFNPDGHHIVENGGGTPIYQRKNADNQNGCTTFGSFGTDNNRNFPFQWACCGGSSGSPCSETYHGPSGNSDPETAAGLAEWRLLFPDQRGPNIGDAAPLTATGILQSMHSNAALDLFPWGFQVSPHAPNDADLRNIARHLSATNAGGNGYTYGQAPEVLYSVDGDTTDQSYGDLGIASFTTEVSGNDFFVPLSYVQNTIWPANRGALVYQAKIARTPYLLAHGPDANTVATNPMTVTQGSPVQLTATINFAWTGNVDSQNVGAAEYYIDTPPWAGGTPVAMTGNFTSPTVPVAATIDTTDLSVGRHLIFVRGRGVNNYQGFQTWGPISAAWLWVQPGACEFAYTTSTGSIVPGTTFVPGTSCNSCTAPLTLPFSYSFYGTAYTAAVVSNKGTLQFTGNSSSGANECLPTAALGGTIFAYWDDLNTFISDQMGVYTRVEGTAPNRIFDIEWRSGVIAAAVQPHFEIRLYEGQEKFDLVYGQTRGGGYSTTVGVQDATGAHHTQFSCNQQGVLSSGLVLTFQRTGCDLARP